MAVLRGGRRALHLSVGFVVGVLFLTSCGGGGTAMSEIIGRAIEVIFDNSTNTLTANNVQSAIEETNAKADVNATSVASLTTRVTTNEADIASNSTLITSNAAAIVAINSRQRKVSSRTSEFTITPLNEWKEPISDLIFTGTLRDVYIDLSINLDNTYDQSTPHDTVVDIDILVNDVPQRSETIRLEENTRHLVNIQWLRASLPLGTHTINFRIRAAHSVKLQTAYLWAIEL